MKLAWLVWMLGFGGMGISLIVIWTVQAPPPGINVLVALFIVGCFVNSFLGLKGLLQEFELDREYK